METNTGARRYLAVDLGAESGRLILGTYANDRWSIEEIQRMANGPVKSADGTLTWNLKGIFEGVLEGLKKVASRGISVRSISCDAWGVDYALIDAKGDVLEPVFHYRDSRCPKGAESLLKRISWDEIFDATGLQFMPINTLFQLETEFEERLGQAEKFLTIGDLFNYWLCGVGKIDISSASTTQMFDPRSLKWSESLIKRAGFPAKIFPEVISCGSALGPILPELAQSTGLDPDLQVLATCSHDTGAAVAATPVEQGQSWAYLSSGTWSLMGVERSQSVINATCQEMNFTNELGLQNSVRLLKNIIGLWLIQELKRESDTQGSPTRESDTQGSPTREFDTQGSPTREFDTQGSPTREFDTQGSPQELKRESDTQGRSSREFDTQGRPSPTSYSQLVKLAEAAEPFRSLINPNDPRFVSPEGMSARIAEFCKETGQAVPETPGQFVRCALESLALLYRVTLKQLEKLTEQPIERLHIFGGGCQNRALNQWTANATGIPVYAGPVEATALGNMMIQAIALGDIDSWEAGRASIGRSFPVEIYQPADADQWALQSELFARLLER